MDAALTASYREVDSFMLRGELILSICFITFGTVCLLIYCTVSIKASADHSNPAELRAF